MILCLHNLDTLNICMREFGSQKYIIAKMTALRSYTIFRIVLKRGYACAIIVQIGADQLIPQLLMEQFDTLPAQC